MFHVGLDIHTRRIAICVLGDTGQVFHRSQVRSIEEMIRILKGLPDRFEVCYEASCGYGHFYDLLSAIEQGDPHAAEQLLPLVYDELRRLAAQKLAREKPGQTVQATALVHEAYIRLVDVDRVRHWESRGHFFTAVAEAMRCILVENARRKGRLKRGGGLHRQDLPLDAIVVPAPAHELLAVHAALDQLESTNRQAADLVKLRYFAGFTIPQAAAGLGISPRKANQVWTYARAWLLAHISENASG